MTSLPKIAPLVVTPRVAAFDNPNWLFELKYEGFRALLEIDSGGARPPNGKGIEVKQPPVCEWFIVRERRTARLALSG